MNKNQIIKLDNWYICTERWRMTNHVTGCYLSGNASNHPLFYHNTTIRTAMIVSYDKELDVFISDTGYKYKLGYRKDIFRPLKVTKAKLVKHFSS